MKNKRGISKHVILMVGILAIVLIAIVLAQSQTLESELEQLENELISGGFMEAENE